MPNVKYNTGNAGTKTLSTSPLDAMIDPAIATVLQPKLLASAEPNGPLKIIFNYLNEFNIFVVNVSTKL